MTCQEHVHGDMGPGFVIAVVAVAEVAGPEARLAELEERLDFSERLLANGRQQDQLPGRVHR